MKKTLLVAALIALSALAAVAETFTATLAWDANPEPDIAGYRIYARELGGSYATPATVTVTNGVTGTVTNLTAGKTYFFVATAFNTSGLESDYSNEVSCVLPGQPGAPANLTIQLIRLAPRP